VTQCRWPPEGSLVVAMVPAPQFAYWQ
jgi:hypothetical protein